MLQSSIVVLSVLFPFATIEASIARPLFDFARPDSFHGWTQLDQPTGTATVTRGPHLGRDPSLRITWRVKKKSQDWPIVSRPLAPPVNRTGYRYLSFDVQCGPENRFPNLKLTDSEGRTAEDSLNNLEPTVIPGRWAHVRVDLEQVGIGKTITQIGFFIGTHWRGVDPGKDYTMDLANVVLERGAEDKYVPPVAEVRPRWSFFFDDEPVVLKVIDRRTGAAPSRLTLHDVKKTLAQRLVKAGERETVIALGKLPAGRYEARLDNLDNVSFSCLPRQASYCRYDWNNALELNGKLMFPVGLHFLEENATDAELAECAAAGFNVAPRPADHPANAIRILDRVQKAGRDNLFLLTGPFDNGEQKSALDYWRDVVSDAKVRRHPSLLGWYIDDEPMVALIPELSQVTRFVKECDPYHPTYVVLNSPVAFKPFSPLFDLLGGDIYPYPCRPIAVVGDYFDRLGQTCRYRKPVIAVLQAFRDVGLAPPPPQTVRAMTYLSIIHGAKGVIYYAYCHQGGQPRDRIWRVPQSDPALWLEMKRIAGELRDLSMPFLQGTDPGIRLAAIPPAVHYRLFDHGPHRYLLLVNVEAKAIECPFELPGTTLPAKVYSIFENTEIAVAKGSPRIEIPGYGVVLYRQTVHH